MRLVFMGTPEFAVPVLEHLVLNDYQVVGVYTQPDRPAGRGRPPLPSPVKEAALARGLPVFQPERLKSPEVIEQLRGLNPEVISVAALGQILPPAVLELPPYRCINVHPSLLPRFRGPSPTAAAILAGEAFTGVSIMLMETGLDTGPILEQASIPIAPWDTTGTLTTKLSQIAARLLPEALLFWTRRELVPRPQKEEEATPSRLIQKEDGALDWGMPAAELGRRVRAFQPWPGAYTLYQGKRLELIEAQPVPEAVARVGEVVALPPGFGVGTGQGVLAVFKVQAEGKKALSSAEFLRVERQGIGRRFPS
ncbi:MAG: methionyl-tRNA formyltransferase [Chloroflexota bacterium]